MLITKTTIEPNTITTFKMVGGDEVIAKVVEISETAYTVSKPHVVLMSQQGFGLVPYVLTADPKLTFSMDKTHVIVASPTLEQVAKEYTKTTTNLIV